MADRLIQAGQVEPALAVLEQARAMLLLPKSWYELRAKTRHGDTWLQVRALREVADRLVEVGQIERTRAVLEQAHMLAQAIRDSFFRSQGLSEIAYGLIRTGQFEQALEASQAIPIKTWVLPAVAAVLFETNEGLSRRCRCWTGSYRTTRVEHWHFDRIFETFALALATAGACKLVEVMAHQAASAYLKALALAATAECLQQRGSDEQVLEAVRTAVVAAKAVTGKQPRVAALTRAAQAAHCAGQGEQARLALDLAIATAAQIKPPHRQVVASSQIAGALAVLGHLEKAREFAAKAQDMARSVRKPATAIDCLAEAAIALAATGQKGVGLTEIDYALGLVKHVPKAANKARDLSTLARSLAAIGETQRALKQAREAQDVLSKAGEQADTMLAQAHLTHTLELVDLHHEALQTLRSALLQARNAGRDAVLSTIAEGAPSLAAIDDGATLWQVYQAIQEVEQWWSVPAN